MEKPPAGLASQGTLAIPVSGIDAAVGLITFLFIICFVVIGLFQLSPPDVVPASAPPTAFSAERAMQHLQVIAQRPHPIGSPEHDKVRDYIVQQLTGLGVSPQIQQTTAVSRRGVGIVSTGTVQNIVARLAGTANTRAIMVVAHYDSVLAGPGANDDGAAVAAMLETLRALRAGPPLKNDLILLFTDGEEAGLLGSSAFVAEHPWAKDVGVVLNVEARGSGGPSLMFQTSDQNGWLIQEFAQAAPYPVTSSLFYEVYKYLPNDTDFTIFKAAGLDGFNFAYIDGFLRYHTALDDLAHVGERSLQHHGSYILELTRHFGAMDIGNTKQPDAVYFNVLRSTLVHYPAAWVLPLLVLVVLVFVAVVVLGFRRGQLRVSGLALGFLAFLACLVLVPLAVWLVLFIVLNLHPQYSLIPQRDTYNSRLYVIAFAALATAIVAALYNLFRRRIRVPDLAIGALLWWLVLAVLTSLFLPGASYLFVWPLLFSLIGMAVLFAPKNQENVLMRRFIVLLLCAVPGIVMFAPLIFMLFVAMTLSFAVPIMLSVVLFLGLLVPQLALMATPSKRLLPLAAALVALGFLVAGSLTSGFDADHPRPDDVLYGLNADSGQATWASAGPQDVWTSQFFSGNAQRAALPTFFPITNQQFIQGQAPVLQLPAPVATVIDDSTANGVRTLRLRITSPRQAPTVFAYIGPRADVRSVAVNGKPAVVDGANQPGPGEILGLLYWALPKEGVELTLELTPAQPVRVLLVDRTDGLPDIPGTSFKPRPAPLMLAPSIGTAEFSDGVLVSKLFTFEAQP